MIDIKVIGEQLLKELGEADEQIRGMAEGIRMFYQRIHDAAQADKAVDPAIETTATEAEVTDGGHPSGEPIPLSTTGAGDGQE